MATFTTRVELHYANDDDYETLHAAMEKEGFSRTVVSDDGITYHLPTAEYNRSGNLTRKQVLDSAKKASVKTGRSYSVLVTESRGRTWHNLDTV